MSDFINAVPDFIDDLTAGRGPLGWLQDDYQIVDRIREAIEKQGPGGVLGLSEPVLDVVRSVVTAVAGVITIIFLTFFMLLEGPRTVQSLLDLLPRDGTAALRARRPRHLQDHLGLRHRKPPDQRGRRDARDGRALRRRQRVRDRARRFSWPCSTSSRSRARRSRRSSSRP